MTGALGNLEILSRIFNKSRQKCKSQFSQHHLLEQGKNHNLQFSDKIFDILCRNMSQLLQLMISDKHLFRDALS